MLTLALILLVGSMWVEWKLVHSFRIIRWVYEHNSLRLIASVGVSVLLGSLFGAAGLICAVAGIGSSVLIQPFYNAEKSGDLALVVKKLHVAKDNFVDSAHRLNKWYENNKMVMIRRWNALCRIVRLMVSPLILLCRISAWCLDKVAS